MLSKARVVVFSYSLDFSLYRQTESNDSVMNIQRSTHHIMEETECYPALTYTTSLMGWFCYTASSTLST